MATIEALPTKARPATLAGPSDSSGLLSEVMTDVLQALASLKLTVTLFALSIVLVLVGTLAQIDHDIWYVVHNYFRSTVAWVELQVFFPRAWGVGGVLPFPGGKTLGALLAVNLLAAHLIRFRIVATGNRSWLGAALLAVGAVITYAVIQSGLGNTVKGRLSDEFCNGLWHAFRATFGGLTLVWAYVLALRYAKRATEPLLWTWWLAATGCAVLIAVVVWLFLHPEFRLDPAGLRILWQLTKALAASLVLLAGCHILFGRRAGVVLLHSGIGLLMFSELYTAMNAQEARMMIQEGQTVNYAEDIRSAELAVVDKSDVQVDRVIAVPASILQRARKSGELVTLPGVPFALRVREYIPNAMTRLAQPGENTSVTHGWGALRVVESRPPATGVGEEQAVDLPAVVVELVNTSDQEALGEYLAWTLPSRAAMVDSFEVAGKPYELGMRFKRIPKDYSVRLIDFRYERFVGTDTAKNFSSELQLVDPENHVDRVQKTWMNNPIRYQGDTLYQSGWDQETERGTILQVVTNRGWMIPYVCCVLVATGMFYHFGLTFWRFSGSKSLLQDRTTRDVPFDWKSPQYWIPALLVLVCAGGIASRVPVPESPLGEPDVQSFGTLPLAYEGRIQPIDTFARNFLTILSGKGSVETEDDKVPAVKWFLDVITDSKHAKHYRVFRIENLDVLDTLRLERREGFRYSVAELAERADETMKQWKLALEVPEAERSLAQKKFLELSSRIIQFNNLRDAFAAPRIRTDSREMLMADLTQMAQDIERLEKRVPRPIPPQEAGGTWEILLAAEAQRIVAGLTDHPVNEATVKFREMLDAYQAADGVKFNSLLGDYQEIVASRAAADAEYQKTLAQQPEALTRKTAERLDLGRVAFEARYNYFNPCVIAMALYLVCFLLAAGSWLGWTSVLNRSANWLLWLTFVLHTYALGARIYISGRPPVTNLYSSAVFIGWAAVLFVLIAEWIFRRGIGNLLAAFVGFPTLFIAYNLAGDGDTFTVLQAVLDTQFWLATHVVCITLGYSATILAGFMGICYVVLSLWLKKLDDDSSKQLVRMMYGTVCFATFFSFVGTVLGGLWADDSWGRFWGWDPKENGALIIVLWNALVLHARWGGMIAARGLAVLAVFGNVVTAWSWFGVNLMGVGLHSYGFTEGRAKWLALFVLTQLAVMALGIVVSSPSRSATPQSPTDEASG